VFQESIIASDGVRAFVLDSLWSVPKDFFPSAEGSDEGEEEDGEEEVEEEQPTNMSAM
jgi:hypothetical protein